MTAQSQRRLGYLSGAPRVSTASDAELGGARTHILGTIQAFRNLGWQVHPFILGDRVPHSWTAEGSERALSSSFQRRLAADLLRLAIRPLGALLAYRQLHGRVDWVYERSAAYQSLGSLFQSKGVPWILEVNAPLFYESRVERKSMTLGELARKLEIAAYQRCDVVVTVSQTLKEILLAEAGIPAQKVIVVPSATDPDFFDPSRFTPIRLFEGPTLVYVGWLVPWQGVAVLLRAMRKAGAEGAAWNLVIVGNGPSRNEWEAVVAELGLEHRVKFVGLVNREDVPRYIAGADLGYAGPTPLQLGKMYHSPLKLYEYMAMAKPVLAASYNDGRNAVLLGKTGWLFESASETGLAESLIHAFRARDRLGRMGQEARQEVLVNHTWTSRVNKLIASVEEILTRGSMLGEIGDPNRG